MIRVTRGYVEYQFPNDARLTNSHPRRLAARMGAHEPQSAGGRPSLPGDVSKGLALATTAGL
ncbi:hypothetical protein EFQ99_02560 [Rhizobium vallis]|uniref:Uncharacterized protein n=1 Tax=Rhizobium vallis TaxID=634290 RepID=A0A3S0T8E6_9HYPH|nr:hypothetical protein EFQ99_02560 [Rhizobium vallis]